MTSSNISEATSGEQPAWPVKTHDFQNHHFDTRIWNKYQFRDSDIIIATWGKSGTTWLQQIVSQLIFFGADEVCPLERSPWLDMRIAANEETLALLEAQTHRRFIKTHAPIDSIVYNPQAKYIFVGRDGRDVMWSMHHHFLHCTPLFYEMVNKTPGRVGEAIERPPEDPAQFFREFLESDTDPKKRHVPFWEHTRGWWNARALPNLLLVHFNDLKADLGGEVRRIAEFLEIKVPEEKWPDIVEHSTFKYMKQNAIRLSGPVAQLIFESGGDTLIHKGYNGRWRDSLTKDEIQKYDDQARSELGEEGARWLANGNHPAGS